MIGKKLAVAALAIVPVSVWAVAQFRVPVDPAALKEAETAARDAQQEGNAPATLRAYRRWLEFYPNEPLVQAGIYRAMALINDQAGQADQAQTLNKMAEQLDPSGQMKGSAANAATTRGSADKLTAIFAAVGQTASTIQQARDTYRNSHPKPMPPPVQPQYAFPPQPVGAAGYQPQPITQPMPGYAPMQQMAQPQPIQPIAPQPIALDAQGNPVPQQYQPVQPIQPIAPQPIALDAQGNPIPQQQMQPQPGQYQPQPMPIQQQMQPQPGQYQPQPMPIQQQMQPQPGQYQPQPMPIQQQMPPQPGQYQPQPTPVQQQMQPQPGQYQPQPMPIQQQMPPQPGQYQPQPIQQQQPYPPQQYQPQPQPMPQQAQYPPQQYQQQMAQYQQQQAQYQMQQGQQYPQGYAAQPAPYRPPPGYSQPRGARRGDAMKPIRVFHDHSRLGDTHYFEQPCGALLMVENGSLTFTPNGGEGAVVIPASEIQELRLNTVVGKGVGAFHIITKKGLYLHLAPEAGTADEGRADIDELRKQLGIDQ